MEDEKESATAEPLNEAPEQASALRIGVERWLTRNGRPIWHEGLQPDVTVALPAAATSDSLVPLVPYLMRDMTVAQLAASQDSQVLKALDVLQGKG